MEYITCAETSADKAGLRNLQWGYVEPAISLLPVDTLLAAAATGLHFECVIQNNTNNPIYICKGHTDKLHKIMPNGYDETSRRDRYARDIELQDVDVWIRTIDGSRVIVNTKKGMPDAYAKHYRIKATDLYKKPVYLEEAGWFIVTDRTFSHVRTFHAQLQNKPAPPPPPEPIVSPLDGPIVNYGSTSIQLVVKSATRDFSKLYYGFGGTVFVANVIPPAFSDGENIVVMTCNVVGEDGSVTPIEESIDLDYFKKTSCWTTSNGVVVSPNLAVLREELRLVRTIPDPKSGVVTIEEARERTLRSLAESNQRNAVLLEKVKELEVLNDDLRKQNTRLGKDVTYHASGLGYKTGRVTHFFQQVLSVLKITHDVKSLHDATIAHRGDKPVRILKFIADIIKPVATIAAVLLPFILKRGK